MNWLSRLSSGLKKTSSGLSEGISGIFTKRRLDDAMLEELEELLLIADVGVASAQKLVTELRAEKFDRDVSEAEVKQFLADHIAAQLAPVAVPLTIPEAPKPYIILVVGVNGNGKTTTIGKLAAAFAGEGKKIMLAAADTFRAAAIDQLRVWAERAQVPLVAGAEGSDPASVAFQAVEAAHIQAVDVLMIDTAGRLHTKENLMAELEKILRVIRKRDPSAPHAVLQVIDATTGQNALRQVEAFHDVAGVTGLIVTKLDGSAKAGVVLALTEQFSLPIHAIGVGEGIADLQPFAPQDFARALLGMA
jgi:fused signal recognition particle receptor